MCYYTQLSTLRSVIESLLLGFKPYRCCLNFLCTILFTASKAFICFHLASWFFGNFDGLSNFIIFWFINCRGGILICNCYYSVGSPCFTRMMNFFEIYKFELYRRRRRRRRKRRRGRRRRFYLNVFLSIYITFVIIWNDCRCYLPEMTRRAKWIKQILSCSRF